MLVETYQKLTAFCARRGNDKLYNTSTIDMHNFYNEVTRFSGLCSSLALFSLFLYSLGPSQAMYPLASNHSLTTFSSLLAYLA
jgi:hypothetical protein